MSVGAAVLAIGEFVGYAAGDQPRFEGMIRVGRGIHDVSRPALDIWRAARRAGAERGWCDIAELTGLMSRNPWIDPLNPAAAIATEIDRLRESALLIDYSDDPARQNVLGRALRFVPWYTSSKSPDGPPRRWVLGVPGQPVLELTDQEYLVWDAAEDAVTLDSIAAGFAQLGSHAEEGETPISGVGDVLAVTGHLAAIGAGFLDVTSVWPRIEEDPDIAADATSSS